MAKDIQILLADPLIIVAIAAGFILLITFLVLVKKPQSGGAKLFFFWILALPIIAVTLYLAGGTIYKNISSATQGPVHWHADFRIFQCGEELDLVDPSGLSNRVGLSEVHEHGDNRIHIEGVLDRFEEASLQGFMEAIGGMLSTGRLNVPTNKGLTTMKNGDLCPDGKEGLLEVFLWQTTKGVARQQKLRDYVDYVISPETLVPPGDCIIFEFGSIDKEKTDSLCEQYEVAEARGDLTIIR